jgi:hypothetical protein
MIDPLATLKDALAERFAIEREIGRGGMATVYLAQDSRHQRPVALKVLHPYLSEGLGPERFLREIQIAVRLQHPHIVPLYDSGHAGALLYYVMPFVEGESLRERLARDRQLPLDDDYLSGSINGFASHIFRIESDGIFIALLKNMKEPGAQIVVKWPSFVTSRILAVLYGEPYEMPRRSAAFAVFEVVRDQGVEAGRQRYNDLVTGEDPAYYVDEDEFRRLAEVLPALREVTVR